MVFPHINPYIGCSAGDSVSSLLTTCGWWTFAKPCCKACCGSNIHCFQPKCNEGSVYCGSCHSEFQNLVPHERQTLHFIDNFLNLYSFRSNRIQWNFLGQIAASGHEGFPTFRDLTPSQSSGCAGGLVAPRLRLQGVLVVWRHQDCVFRVCWWFGSTKTASSGCAGGLAAPKLTSIFCFPRKFHYFGILTFRFHTA